MISPKIVPLGSLATVVDCEHKTAPRSVGPGTYGYSIGTGSIKNGRVDLSRAKPVDRETHAEWARRLPPRPGDLILAREAPIGEPALVPQGIPICLGQRTVLIRPDGARLDTKYLLHWLMSPTAKSWMASHATGSTVLHLNVADVKRIPVNLATLDEQRRIVEILEDHLSRLDAAEDLLVLVEKRWSPLTTAVIQSAIPIPSPMHWVTTTVGEAGAVDLGRQRHPDWHAGPEMRPYLRVANVFEDRIDTSDVMQMDFSGVFERYRLNSGDVLLNEGQSPEWLGRPAIYRGQPENVAFTNSLLRFRAREGVLPEWALLVFRRHMRSGRFRRESRITTNIAHLSAGRLKGVEFPVPPRVEQEALVREVAARLSEVEAARSAVRATVRRSGAMRRALLAAAFSGRLTGVRDVSEVVEEMAGV